MVVVVVVVIWLHRILFCSCRRWRRFWILFPFDFTIISQQIHRVRVVMQMSIHQFATTNDREHKKTPAPKHIPNGLRANVNRTAIFVIDKANAKYFVRLIRWMLRQAQSNALLISNTYRSIAAHSTIHYNPYIQKAHHHHLIDSQFGIPRAPILHHFDNVSFVLFLFSLCAVNTKSVISTKSLMNRQMYLAKVSNDQFL